MFTVMSFFSSPLDFVNNLLNASHPNIIGFLQSSLSKYKIVLYSLSYE